MQVTIDRELFDQQIEKCKQIKEEHGASSSYHPTSYVDKYTCNCVVAAAYTKALNIPCRFDGGAENVSSEDGEKDFAVVNELESLAHIFDLLSGFADVWDEADHAMVAELDKLLPITFETEEV